MKTCWIAAVLLSAAAACGVGTQGCSSSLSNPQSSASVPVAPAPPAGLLTPAGQATLAAAEDLSSFVPLLSQPALSSALQAFEAEDYATCAGLVEAHIQASQLSVLDEPRWYLLLGTLREKSSDLLGATRAYERATQSAWPLADYAALGLGRSLLGLADWDGAERALASVPANSGSYASASRPRAEA